MRISLNMFLHELRHFDTVTGTEFDGSKSFLRVAPLNLGIADGTVEDCLYVGTIEDISKLPSCGGIILITSDKALPPSLGKSIFVRSDISCFELILRLNTYALTITQWYENMLMAIATQKGIQEILTLSEPVIGNFISVSDSALSLVAYTKNISVSDPVIEYLLANGYHSEETYKHFKEGKRFEIWMEQDGLIVNTDRNIGTDDIVSRIFKYDRTYFMHAVMSCNNSPITYGLLELFDIMCNVLENIIRNSWNSEKFFSHNYNSFIIDLIKQTNTADRQSIEKRASFLGVDPNDEYIVIVAETINSSGKAFPGKIAQDLFSMFPRIHIIHYEDKILLLIHVQKMSVYMESTSFCVKLTEYLSTNGMRCGVSDIFTDILELSTAYQQALLAVTNGNPDNVITYFENVIVNCMLNTTDNVLNIWSQSKFGKILIELYNSDREKNQNNILLLHAYMRNERRARETADEIHMHRNNVVYRINRIAETYNLNFDDAQTRVNILLSFLMFNQWLIRKEGISPERDIYKENNS